MCHDQWRVPLADLYPRKIPDGTIVWTSPTGRIYRTTPAGYDLFPQLRPACRTPTARGRSRSREKALRIARARSTIRDQRPVNAETRRINQARRREIEQRKWRNHMRKMLILLKGRANPAPAPGALGAPPACGGGSTTPANPKNSHPTGNHHHQIHNNSTTTHRSDPRDQTRVVRD